MGLLTGFVLVADRRGLLAIAALAISISYALLAGASAAGVQRAQDVLGKDLQSPAWVAARPELGAFDAARLPVVPTEALDVFFTEEWTYYTRRANATNATDLPDVLAGAATGLASGTSFVVAGTTYRVQTAQPPPGAASDWIGVSRVVFQRLGGLAGSNARVAVFDNLTQPQREALEAQGFRVMPAPAVVPFYTEGANDLVRGVGVTILASTLVVGLISASFVALEIEARRASLNTLRFYAGRRRVQGIIAARGVFLLVVAHALAVAASAGLVLLVAQAGNTPLGLQPVWVALTMASTFLGGLAGIAAPVLRSHRRLQARELTGRAPRRAWPPWLRPILTSWRNLLPLTVSAFVLVASLGVILGGAAIPNQIFGSGDTDVIAAPNANPLRGRVNAFAGENLHRLDAFEAASPEVFAPTIYEGHPLMVRGVQWPRLVELDNPRVTDGGRFQGPGEAVAGERLARLLGWRLGDHVLLPASYTTSVVSLQIIGTIEAGNILDDELLVDLETARALADTPPTSVNLVRVRQHREPGQPAPGARLPQGIEIVAPRLEPAAPLPNEPAFLTVEAINFASRTATRHLTLQVNGRPVSDAWISLPAGSSTTHTFTFRAPPQGVQSVAINPTVEPPPNPPAYRVGAPDQVASGSPLPVTITDFRDRPQGAVDVSLDGETVATLDDGTATLHPTRPGNRTLFVRGPQGAAARAVLVVAPEDLSRPHARIVSLAGPLQNPPGDWPGVLQIENIGAQTFEGRPFVLVDGALANVTAVRILPGAVQRVPFQVPLTLGRHVVQADNLFLNVTVRAEAQAAQTDTSQLTIPQLLELRRQAAQARLEQRSDATTAFLGETYKNLNAALIVIVLVTVLHASLIALVSVHRETEERSESLATLTALGADTRQLRRRALREYLPIGLAAAVLGTFLGLALARLGAEIGLLEGFGHALLPRTDLEFALRLIAVAVGSTLAAAAISIESLRTKQRSLQIAQGPRRSDRPGLDEVLRGGRR